MTRPQAGGDRGRIKRWRITDRDLRILVFLVKYGAATADQVRREFFKGSDKGPAEGPTQGPIKAAYRRLKALEARGVVEGERVFYRMPQVYRVTEDGARLAGVDLSPPRKDLSRLRHHLEVLELSWKLRSGDAGPGEGVEGWITERELRRDKLAERREKETGRMIGKGRMGRRPDGLLVLENGEEIAVELELTPKRAPDYHRIFSDYAEAIEAGELDGVRFYFSGRKAMARVEELCRKHGTLPHDVVRFDHHQPAF